ncbi:putative conserved lipoprotein LpqG [Streptomyces daqingensis]|uniref:Conserved lipoprotein LpqG n=1 Tax=Streptomyces daqingensis TaxID=1472640 RepID=A0ABQ2MGF8_9ACTN|nr:SIMPL domain-containing protein [Streptomyces daqingensis]GGO51302.1 putative conserved lipoprotein LpqG [Streptomyces daqingensis]
MTNTPGHTAESGPVPYGTPDEPRVAVRGEASLEFDPEVANISVQVASRGTGRRDALKMLTRRNSEVLELVKSYGEAVEKLSTGSFSVTPELAEKGRRERVRCYNGRVQISVTVGDFTALGEMTTRLADLEMTRVSGPWWALRPDSPAHREARQQAVREAVTRAREYAGALGADLVALVELADQGAESPAPPPPMGMRTASYGGAAPEGAPALDLEPRRQRVHAQVNARFVMSRPAL